MTREELAKIRSSLTSPVVPRGGAPASAVGDALRVPALSPHAAALLAFAEHRLRGGSEVPEWVAAELRTAAARRDDDVAEALRRTPWLDRR
jgi:hypothetical protein